MSLEPITLEICAQHSMTSTSYASLIGLMGLFHEIAKKTNLSYWITFGTLLGKVRHGGLTPWDDDLDVAVLERDESKLKNTLRVFCCTYPQFCISPYQYKPTCRGYKLYLTMGDRVLGMDIFLMKEIEYNGVKAYDSGWGDDIYTHTEVFGTTGAPVETSFGYGVANMPHSPEPYLHRQYAKWDTVAFIHHRENPAESKSYSLTPSLLTTINAWIREKYPQPT